MIRSATQEDAGAIAGIYNHYILNSVITFEEEVVSPTEMAGRIGKVRTASLPYLVEERDDRVIGYAYAGRWHDRSAYRYSVETTIYLDADYLGKNIGSGLYAALLQQLKERGMHVAIGGIALPNPGSVALHEKLGFRKVAHYAEVGFKFNQWIDVGYWQHAL